MTTDQKPYWFPAKRIGWGWGLPTAWQGWIVLAVYFFLLMVGAVIILPVYGPAAFNVFAGVLTLLLIIICWAKGERPRWRSGNE
jgi:apolipoprotein N-acyltransferase